MNTEAGRYFYGESRVAGGTPAPSWPSCLWQLRYQAWARRRFAAQKGLLRGPLRAGLPLTGVCRCVFVPYRLKGKTLAQRLRRS